MKEEFRKNYLTYTEEGVHVSYTGKDGVDIDDYFEQEICKLQKKMVTWVVILSFFWCLLRIIK